MRGCQWAGQSGFQVDATIQQMRQVTGVYQGVYKATSFYRQFKKHSPDQNNLRGSISGANSSEEFWIRHHNAVQDPSDQDINLKAFKTTVLNRDFNSSKISANEQVNESWRSNLWGLYMFTRTVLKHSPDQNNLRGSMEQIILILNSD